MYELLNHMCFNFRLGINFWTIICVLIFSYVSTFKQYYMCVLIFNAMNEYL